MKALLLAAALLAPGNYSHYDNHSYVERRFSYDYKFDYGVVVFSARPLYASEILILGREIRYTYDAYGQLLYEYNHRRCDPKYYGAKIYVYDIQVQHDWHPYYERERQSIFTDTASMFFNLPYYLGRHLSYYCNVTEAEYGGFSERLQTIIFRQMDSSK